MFLGGKVRRRRYGDGFFCSSKRKGKNGGKRRRPSYSSQDLFRAGRIEREEGEKRIFSVHFFFSFLSFCDVSFFFFFPVEKSGWPSYLSAVSSGLLALSRQVWLRRWCSYA